jgi:hypothetical protein
MVNDETYIIGERALALAEHISDLDDLCSRLAKEVKHKRPVVSTLI